MLPLLLLGFACSREAPAPPPAMQVVPAPAPVSIRRLRGFLLHDGTTLVFRPCGEDTLAAIQGAAVAELQEVFSSLAGGDAGVAIGVELTGAVRSLGEGRVLDAAALAVALPPGQEGLCAYDAGFTWRASGQEPFWSATLVEDRLSWLTPDLGSPLELPVTTTRHAGGVISLSGELEGHHLDLSFQPARCRDGMSGAVFSFTATALVDGASLRGCAQEGWPAPVSG